MHDTQRHKSKQGRVYRFRSHYYFGGLLGVEIKKLTSLLPLGLLDPDIGLPCEPSEIRCGGCNMILGVCL